MAVARCLQARFTTGLVFALLFYPLRLHIPFNQFANNIAHVGVLLYAHELEILVYVVIKDNS